MALKAEITAEAFTSLNDALKTEYELNEAEGTYVLRVEEVEDTSNLVKAYTIQKTLAKKLEDENKEMKNRLRDFDVAARDAKKLADAAKTDELKAKGEYESLWQRTKMELQEKEAEFDRRISEREAHYRGLLLDKEIRAYAVTKGGIIPETVDNFLDSFKRRFDLAPNGDILTIGRDGQPTHQTLEKHFSALRAESPWFADSRRKGGGGDVPAIPGVSVNGSGMTVVDISANGGIYAPTKEQSDLARQGRAQMTGFLGK